MGAPLSTNKNKYHENEKRNDIETPHNICNFIYDLVSPVISKEGFVFDTCAGAGNLLVPFNNNGFNTFGIEIEEYEGSMPIIQRNFLKVKPLEYVDGNISLVVQNPPFNRNEATRKYLHDIKKGNALLAELFLEKTWEVFGNNVPCVCLVPMGVRLNQRIISKRWRKMRDFFPAITSIISLPLDVFIGVEFQCEILIFNLPKLAPHYFVPEHYFK
jgi:type I restriction enzyme M protein